MTKAFEFDSILSTYLQGVIEEKRSAGYTYDTEGMILKRFDQYCIDKHLKSTKITKEFLSDWMSQSDDEKEMQQAKRISCVRQLLLYMASMGMDVYIPSHFCNFGVHLTHILAPEELSAFFHELDLLTTESHARHSKRMIFEYRMLFRLIYCCGLRNSEAAGIAMKNVNLDNGVLSIYNSKGRKDRLVYMQDDLTGLCRDYYSELSQHLNCFPEWLFPGMNINQPIPNTSVDNKFSVIWSRTEYAETCTKKPTVHSLRFTFVVNRINEWIREGADINVMLPYLSRYLGHKTVNETFYYYYYVKEANDIVREKDKTSKLVIPEVML